MNHGLTQVIINLLDQQMKKSREGKKNLVYLSTVLLWVGIVCTGIFLIPGLIVPLCTGNWEATWFFLIFAAGSASMILGYCNCRIWYTETGFTAGYFLGYRREFSYEDIESIQGKRDIKLKVRGKTVRLDEIAVGRREFLALAKKQYRKTHGGKPIPVIEKEKWDIFNGHVDSPGEFVFAFALVGVLIAGGLIAVLVCMKPRAMEELTFCAGSIGHYEEISWGWDLALSCGGRELEISSYRYALADPEAFLESCGAGQTFTVGYSPITDEGDIVGYAAHFICDSTGKLWLTPEAVNRVNEGISMAIFAIFGAMWAGAEGAAIYVGRNPHKFSKRVIRMFFKDGYVH